MNRVLIVDDARPIRSRLMKQVENVEQEIVVAGDASNGQKALEWLAQYYADICITDVRMPVMDGLELIKQINTSYPWMACMVVSSYDEFEYAKQSVQLGVADYILKPIDRNLLQMALERTVQELQRARDREAAEILLSEIPRNRHFLERWIEQIRINHGETMPVLIVDTLELLEHWMKGKYYLMNALTMAWLNLVIKELWQEGIQLELDEGKDSGLGESVLPNSQIRCYFRLCSVKRLEEGAFLLLEKMGGIRDRQNTKLINEIKSYIHEHFADKLNLQQMADDVAISKNYMCNVFKQDTGMTIWGYVVLVRMQRARDLLLGSALKSYEIANRVGYEDIVYFSQLFKKQYGLSPMEYKKRMKQ